MMNEQLLVASGEYLVESAKCVVER